MSSISFKVSQSRPHGPLGSSKALLSQEEEESRDLISEVDTRQGLRPGKKAPEELIIPCPGDSLEAKAVEELLSVSKDEVSSSCSSLKRENTDSLIYQASLSKAGKEATDDDYESVPIEKFGMAMLKGMGWTANSQKTVATLETPLRPKGLGLGAALPKKQTNKASSDKKEDEQLEMLVGAYVLVTMGSHKSKYGKVTGFDEGTGRAFIKMALSSEIVSISENALMLVSKKDYKEKGKILNQEEYDRHAKQKGPSSLPSNPLGLQESMRKIAKDRRAPISSPLPKKKMAFSWAAPHLRVRYINQKDGRYFNSKMIVQDVTTPTTCVLRSESDGRILEQVSLMDLETVIPKTTSSNQKVMIVRSVGSARKGTIACIISKDKGRCKAVVQSTYDQKDVWDLDFDDLCEYLGDEFGDGY